MDVLNTKRPRLLLALTILVVFLPAFFSHFVLFDDDLHIFRNPNLGLPFFQALEAFWEAPYKGFYIPVTYTVWTVLVAISKVFVSMQTLEELPAFPFHAANVLLHLCNALFVFRILYRFVPIRKYCVVGALLFACHPLQVESVAWATGMKDIISTFFVLGAIDLYLSYLADKQIQTWVVATACFILALLGKPSVISVPVALFLMSNILLGVKRNRAFILSFVWILIAVPFVIMTAKLQPPDLLQDITPIYQRPLIFLDSIFFYLRKTFLPFPLIQDYSRTPAKVLQSFEAVVTSVMLLCLCFYLYAKRYWLWLVLLAVFTSLLLPVSGIVPFAFQNFSTVADHYMYLPLLVFALGAVYWLERSKNPRKEQIAIGVVILLGALSFRQTLLWNNTYTLFQETLRFNPQSVIAHNNLAVYYEGEEDLEKALSHYQAASASNPRFSHHHYNVGNVYLKLGERELARPYFLKTLQLDEKYSDAYFNLGIIEESYGNYKAALEHFNNALRYDAKMAKAAIKAGSTMVQLGKVDEGIALLNKSLFIDTRNSHQAYYYLGNAYLAKKNLREAKSAYESALAIHPNYERAREALTKLGAVKP